MSPGDRAALDAQSSGGTLLVRLLMPVLLHRTESKRGPCAAWLSSGRTDIPEIHPEIPYGGISKKVNVLFIPSSGIPRSRLLDSRRWLDSPFDALEDVSAIRHDEANKYSAVFLAELPNGLQIAGLNSGTLVDRADVRQSTGTLRIRRLYVSPAQHPRTGRNVRHCELPLSRMRRCYRVRNKSAQMSGMWQTLVTGVGTNLPSRREQGEAILVSEIIDKWAWKMACAP